MERIKSTLINHRFYNDEIFSQIKIIAKKMDISVTTLLKNAIYDIVQEHPENMRLENKGLNIKD
jgi:hypothetical protein